MTVDTDPRTIPTQEDTRPSRPPPAPTGAVFPGPSGGTYRLPLAGANGPQRPQLTDSVAQQAANDPTLIVTYPGQFHLTDSAAVSDGCHANTAVQASLGHQVLMSWG